MAFLDLLVNHLPYLFIAFFVMLWVVSSRRYHRLRRDLKARCRSLSSEHSKIACEIAFLEKSLPGLNQEQTRERTIERLQQGLDVVLRDLAHVKKQENLVYVLYNK